MRHIVTAVLCCLFLLEATCQAQAPAPLQYQVSFDDRAAHYVNVTMTIPAPATDTVDLMMATWTPGSYIIREYSRHVDHVTVDSTAEVPVSITKSSKNHWQVKCVPGKDVKVHWRVYCREMSVRTNWVDDDMAILCGAATFLTVAGAPATPHQVQFNLPAHWNRSVTSMNAVEGKAHTYLASTFDELVDAPVLCGNPVIQDFAVGGASHVLASLGDSSLWDTAKAAADVQRIVAQQHQFWGTVPYSRYSFLNVIAEASGGLEHDNSTLIMTSRWNFRDKDKYEDWLSLVSHEFFHTWNVRRVRPAALSPYNYETENNVRTLWVAEGITSYYEDLMLVRAGLIDRNAYLRRFSKNIERLQGSTGRTVQSLSESSLDAWIKFYRPDENSANTRVSYYVKGCVVGFLMDAKIRELTAGAKSLDDVMRLLYQRHAGPKGYSDSEFTAVVSEVAGTDMTGWIAEHVDSINELNYQQALNWYGLQLPEEPAKPEDAKADASKKGPISLGIQTNETTGSLMVSGVTNGSTAHKAGFNVDDEILAFNQYRASVKTWRDQLNQLGVGSKVKVLISRRGELRTLEVTLTPETVQRWQLRFADKPSDDQKARVTSWLGK
ncbi:MAG: M61 family metallopeptidase [Planctomycetaceae bacterium]|nr:M61 family metallopeptidase [Planctomycetaceae bacterium]